VFVVSNRYYVDKVFQDYFGELDEESIRDNFVIIYELLDETMDFGHPQSLDSKILREYFFCYRSGAQSFAGSSPKKVTDTNQHQGPLLLLLMPFLGVVTVLSIEKMKFSSTWLKSSIFSSLVLVAYLTLRSLGQ